MLSCVVFSLAIAIITAQPAFITNPLSKEAIDYINSLNLTWKAGQNFDDSIYTIEYIKGMCGALKSPKPLLPSKLFDDEEEEKFWNRKVQQKLSYGSLSDIQQRASAPSFSAYL